MRLLDLHACSPPQGSASPWHRRNKTGVAWLPGPPSCCCRSRLSRRASRCPTCSRETPAGKLQRFVAEIENGLPSDASAFACAWAMTVVNWLVKVLVLAWALRLMGVVPTAASFGGALGGELSRCCRSMPRVGSAPIRRASPQGRSPSARRAMRRRCRGTCAGKHQRPSADHRVRAHRYGDRRLPLGRARA